MIRNEPRRNVKPKARKVWKSFSLRQVRRYKPPSLDGRKKKRTARNLN
jgi:hypothetical protein